MIIGNVDFGKYPVSLAPMEDVTDPSFRLICREQGASMVYTEFVSAEALIRDISSTVRKLDISDAERPVAIQIYGREPEAMVEAAKIVEAAGPDVLDINFGCPVKKVAGKGGGAGMLRDIPKLLSITEQVVNAVKIPVTVKTRLGWDCENKIIHSLALDLQELGIAALTVHGRTRSQMYNGNADWSLIGEIASDERFKLPLIGNGDVTSPEICRENFRRFGVDGIMVGRAAIGAPWIFHDIRQFLDNGTYTPLSDSEKMKLLRRQIAESVERIDEYRGILHIRRHLAATPLFKGIADFRPTRIRMLQTNSFAQLNEILDEIEEKWLPRRNEETLK